MKNQHNYHGLIGPVDDARRERLFSIAEVIQSSSKRTTTLRFPDYNDLERSALNDLPLDGPKTLLPLPRMLADYSQLIRNGVPVVSEPQFQKLALPIIDRSLEAAFGNSADVGDQGVNVALPSPKRVSAYVVISERLRLQNDLLTSSWVEQQLLSALGRALDKAAIIGDGNGDNPLGFLNDGILNHTRATAGIDTLTDITAMQKAISDADGEANPENYLFVADAATRQALQTAEGIGNPIWSKDGPLGHAGIASVHCPADTLVLAQTSAMAFIDFNRLELENVIDVDQATAGYRQMMLTGYFDFVTLDPNGICQAVDA